MLTCIIFYQTALCQSRDGIPCIKKRKKQKISWGRKTHFCCHQLKIKNPLQTKIRFIKINIFKDTNERHMNAEPYNPSISRPGLQHRPTCHRPNKSLRSGFTAWSHPLSQLWRLCLPPTAHWQAFDALICTGCLKAMQSRLADTERCVATRQLTDKVVSQQARWCAQHAL